MPTDERISRLFKSLVSSCLSHAEEIQVDNLRLRVVTAPYFIGTKLEAFRGRGRGDFYASRDLENIVAVIDGRASLLDEINSATISANSESFHNSSRRFRDIYSVTGQARHGSLLS